MKKITTILVVMFISFSSYAQTSFFEALQAHDKDARFQEYWSVSKGDKEGSTNISGKRYWVGLEIETLPSGESVGFKLINEEDGKTWDSETALSDYGRLIGFPNVSSIYHSYKKEGFVAIDDYIFKISGISKDGSTFKNIERIYIKENKELANSSDNEDSKPEKKKKFGAMMGKVAKASVGIGSETGGSGPEYKKAISIDMYALVTKYLKDMNAKQNAYSLTASDKQSIQAIENARDSKDAYFKAQNDSIKATPEYQKMMEQQNMITLRNVSSETIYIWTKYPGKEMNSKYTTYLSEYGDETSTFCEEKTLYYTTSPLSNGAKYMLDITKSDCKRTISIP